MHRQYMLTAAISRQKIQKAEKSDPGLIERWKQQAAEAIMASSSRAECLTESPTIMYSTVALSFDVMELVLMTPNGRWSAALCAELSAGGQKSKDGRRRPEESKDGRRRLEHDGRQPEREDLWLGQCLPELVEVVRLISCGINILLVLQLSSVSLGGTSRMQGKFRPATHPPPPDQTRSQPHRHHTRPERMPSAWPTGSRRRGRRCMFASIGRSRSTQ